MNRLLFIIFLFLSFETFSQKNGQTLVTFEFYPAFESSSEIQINFKKTVISVDLENQEKSIKTRMIDEDYRNLNTLIDSLSNNLDRPIVTRTIDGEEHILEDFYAEDGMIVYINFTNPTRRVELGNIFSSTQSELLIQIITVFAERTNKKDYFNKLIEYLK